MTMIRFPQQHIADSVAQRILQVAAQLKPRDKVEAQGAQLDQALQQPVGDVAPLEGIEEALIARTLDL